MILKSCPFCGGEAKYKKRVAPYINGGHPTTSTVLCIICGASISQTHDCLELKSVVIDAWNKRAEVN